MEIPVTYQCWGCGSEKTEYEKAEEPIPAKTVWNLCPDCREKKRKGGETVEIKAT